MYIHTIGGSEIMLGPGKYADLCSEIKDRVCAEVVVLIILSGDKGDSVSMDPPLEYSINTPKVLRELAAKLEIELERGEI